MLGTACFLEKNMVKPLNVIEMLVLILNCNLIPLWTETELHFGLKLTATIILILLYIVIIFRKGRANTSDKRLVRLNRSCSLILSGGVTATAQLIILIYYIFGTDMGAAEWIFTFLFMIVSVGIVLFSGVLRAVFSSKQIKITDHIAMLFMWWVPLTNIILLRKFYKTAKREYIVESDRLELENARAENEVCKTKYPVLMVHGIFFRDWQKFNYWGRVPAALIRNGATIYYGNQQSAQSIEGSAKELCSTIEKVIAETGAEKVNIIAHSKGGLDSRYAISCLGMDKYTATLTTINTPHKGCDMVDYLLSKIPQGAVEFLENKYNKLFTVLGDTKPDFLSGVKDLSAEKAKTYDEIMPDSENVSYRSSMSVMQSSRSAGMPLNVGYSLIKKLNGASDGLVWEESAKHGEFELIKNSKIRGISHGDVIDLFRENIDGYDVREYYVGILKRLKDEGY